MERDFCSAGGPKTPTRGSTTWWREDRAGENGKEAAYRELREETAIGRDDIELFHMMDFVYYNQDCRVEVYVGTLKRQVELREEKHPLLWLSSHEDFFDRESFAGEGNIGHMVEQVIRYGTGKR